MAKSIGDLRRAKYAALGTLLVVLFGPVLADAQGGRGGGRGGRGGRGGGAPPAPAVPVDPHDLSGYWLLPPDPRDGRSIPDAQLLPGVTADRLAEAAEHDWEAVRYCNPVGLPAMMGLGSPYRIQISPSHMVVLTEYAPAPNRWIYLNRSEHIPAEAYDAGFYGDSVGHWESDTLVVETTMINPDMGIVGIPGGGFRTAASTLVERFRLLKNGQVLQLVSTWTDPTVFASPHTYEYRYSRMPPGYDGRLGSGCDPYDDERTEFLSEQR
jgi:hypothetical protein